MPPDLPARQPSVPEQEMDYWMKTLTVGIEVEWETMSPTAASRLLASPGPWAGSRGYTWLRLTVMSALSCSQRPDLKAVRRPGLLLRNLPSWDSEEHPPHTLRWETLVLERHRCMRVQTKACPH